MSARDGGPAFPAVYGQGLEGNLQIGTDEPGLSIRDWFAAHEQQIPNWRDIASFWGCEENEAIRRFNQMTVGERYLLSAKLRYMFADAMLAEREKDQ